MKKIIHFFTRICEAYLPDAFVFSLILTLVVLGFGWVLTTHSLTELIGFWGKDFWSLNAFAMQMVFVLISGHMLATTPGVKRFLAWLSHLPKSESQALVMLSTFSLLACWLNWGFGLIVSGILAAQFARSLGKVNFGLFVATAYAGFLVWHGGLSGSIPLKIASGDEVLSKIYPNLIIPLSETIFSVENVLIILSLLVMIPVLSLWMRTDEKVTITPEEVTQLDKINVAKFRDMVETWRWFNIIFFLFFVLVITQGLLKGEGFDINKVNLIFLSLALLLHGTPKNFLRALQESFSFASGLVIQFPFYAGIMGLMQYSGLADQVSAVFVSISSAQTLPLFTFLSGGLVNFFVPSGGGQWVVQGPIMLKAAQDLGADPAKISMALAWGDAWTNMIQPFWALPILALAKLQLKDIMGYCLVFTFFSGLLISAVLFFL